MMLKNKMKQSALAVALIVGSASTQAGTISLQTTSPVVTEGDLFELEILMDFTDGATIGGGFDLLFDSSLVSYVAGSYVVDPVLGSDPAFTRDDSASADAAHRIDVGLDSLIGLAFGNFGGLTGPSRVGTLQFMANNTGFADFGLIDTTNSTVGIFYGSDFSEQYPNYIGAQIEIEAVPVPAAVWLFGSGLIGLAGIARRRQA